MVDFEQKFYEKTANKWKDRDYFQQKPGKYILQRKEQDKEMIQKYSEQEALIMELIQNGHEKFKPAKITDESVMEVVSKAWDIECWKKVMTEF